MAAAALAPYDLTPDDVTDVVERLRSVRRDFRAAKTVAQQDALLHSLGVVVELDVCAEYDAGAASHYEIDATKWCRKCDAFMSFIQEVGLDLNLIGWDAPAEDEVWKQTVSLNNRHLVCNNLSRAGILGSAILNERQYVRTPAIHATGTGGVDPSGCGPTRAHGYESARCTTDGFAPRDRICAHVDGNHVRGAQRGAVRLQDESIVLSTLGHMHMTARNVERSSIQDAVSFQRVGWSVFTMTHGAREVVKHAVVANPSGHGGVSFVSNFINGDETAIHASARRVLFCDWMTSIIICGQEIIIRLEDDDDDEFMKLVDFRAAPRELVNLKTDAQRLRSVYGGNKARDLGVGAHAVDEEGVHFNAVKGGCAARDLGVGVHGLSAEERQEIGKKGGCSARDLGVGAHALSAEERQEIGKKGGCSSRDAGVGIHGLSAEERQENGKKGGCAARDAGVGIHGRTAEQHSKDSAIGGSRSMVTIWNRFASANAHRIRTIFIYAEDAMGEIHEYVVECIPEKVAHKGPVLTPWYHRFRWTQATVATLAKVIESHITNDIDRQLCVADIQNLNSAGASTSKPNKAAKYKYPKLHVPEANATLWNDEEYRREVKFVRKFKFLARLCRYVVFRESEHDAYESSVVDAS